MRYKKLVACGHGLKSGLGWVSYSSSRLTIIYYSTLVNYVSMLSPSISCLVEVVLVRGGINRLNSFWVRVVTKNFWAGTKTPAPLIFKGRNSTGIPSTNNTTPPTNIITMVFRLNPHGVDLMNHPNPM
jgi:hypothetical protein